MNAAFMLDFALVRKYLLSQSLIGIFVGVFMAFFLVNPATIAGTLVITFPLFVSMLIFSLDEKQNWQSFRLALPLSRQDIVRGHYASLALAIAFGWLFSMILTGLIVLVSGFLAPVFPDATLLSELVAACDWSEVVFTGLVVSAMMLFVFSFLIPCFCRFGYTKGVSYFPLAFFLFWVAFLTALGFLADNHNLGITDTLIQTWQQSLTLSCGFFIIAFGLFVASSFLAVKLYEKREF